MGLLADTRDYLSRKLQAGEPQTFIDGGGTIDDPFNRTLERDRDQLDEYARIYRQGGPVASLLDIRALMTFGTGSEFVDGDDVTALVDGEVMTPAEWLDATFNDRDNLFVEIGRDAYIFGDAFGEIVETRGGGFSHVELIQPHTMMPQFNDKGTIQRWEQTVKLQAGQTQTQPLNADEVAHFAVKRLGRQPLGLSLIAQNYDEIMRFARNQEAIAHALKLHGFPKWQIKVGPEGGQSISDRILKRVRSRFRDFDERTNFTTGRDVDIESLDTGKLEIEGVTEHDLMVLAASMGVPEEMAGLGRGSTEATAKVRLQAFERTARAEQRSMADQFIQQVVRPVLEQYSPFSKDVDIDLRFGDVVSDQTATAEWLQNFKSLYTVDEMREKLGDGPVPEDVDEEDLGPPDTSADANEQGPFGGLSQLSDGGEPTLAAEETVYNRLFADVVWADDTSRELFSFDDEEVPQFAAERIKEAIRGGAVFSHFEDVPSSDLMALRETLIDSLETQHGWSINSLTKNLRETVPNLGKQEAERIARTETASIVNHAREMGYEERAGDVDDLRFDWTGPDDHRNSDACPWIKSQIPEGGVTLERLKELVEEGGEKFGSTDPREWVPHINCRHTYVRVVE